MASSGLNSSIPGDSNFIIKELDRVASLINVLLLLFTSFMCEKPRSHAVLVAGSARIRSKTFKIFRYSFPNLVYLFPAQTLKFLGKYFHNSHSQ